MRKLFCYVDESGQDTFGALFLVSVVVAGPEREQLERLLAKIERETGKGKVKWSKAHKKRRNDYMQRVLKEPAFKGALHFARYHDTTDYVELTIRTTAQAIRFHTKERPEEVKATIIVDGLRRSEYRGFSSRLRQDWGIRTKKVRGARDESNIFIRLADALCGFLREAESGREEPRRIRDRAIQAGYLTRLGEE